MIKRYIISLLGISFILSQCFGQHTKSRKQEVDFVNNHIGTAIKGDGGVALTVGSPFMMTNFAPQTCENRINQLYYAYEDSTILGFVASHQPTVWMGDYGYVSVMPEIGKLKTHPQERKLPFSHTNEIVSPYYYSVKMDAGNNKSIKTELVARERCSMMRFTFPESNESHIVVQGINIDDTPEPFWNPELNSKAQRLEQMTSFVSINKDKNEIIGYNTDRHCLSLGPELKNFKGYFIIQFEKSFDAFGTWNNDSVMQSGSELVGKKRIGAYVSFSTKKNEIIKAKIATSFISIEQARENMSKEIPDWDFEIVKTQTRDDWQKILSTIQVEGATDEQKTIFYTAFYHCLLFPRMFSEYGKYYSAFDDKIHEGVSYSDFSLWDTFRALHPLLIFVQPKRVNDMITAMLQMYKEGGRLPMWPNPAETNIMIGTHADAVIADAYVKGLRDYDIPLAYEAMRKDAMIPTDCDIPANTLYDRQKWSCYEGQAGLQFFHTLGFIPSDYKAESVSRSIEYGIDDYCIAQLAKDLGKTDDYERLMRWSINYKNLYNKETGFFSPRLYNGNWDPDTTKGFTEGSPWTYRFGVMHDIQGMIDLMGGNENFAKQLDLNFSENHYRHNNEPGHHYIYLYNYCRQPWKTQELVRVETMQNYRNTPDGLNGNDDCGQMSAWYLFSVMGFYPVTPASGLYSIGAPQFPKITMKYWVNDKPQTFEIIAKNLSPLNKYIQRVTLDGKPVEKPLISHNDILNCKQLIFEMGDTPNYGWK